MVQAPGTRPSLLVRLRDNQDREAWAEFVELYAPMIYGLARRRGLQDADAADLTQEVLRCVSEAFKTWNYDSRRGRFRGWLYTVTRNRLHDFLACRARREQAGGDSRTQALLGELPAPDAEEASWEREYRQQVFHQAAERVREAFNEASWRAFWLTAVEGKSGEETARVLGLSVGAVYVARSRILARLKQQISLLHET
jgi:RNA polymerase sigma factor (sigma-70 family)